MPEEAVAAGQLSSKGLTPRRWRTHASGESQGTVGASTRLRRMRIIGTRLCLLVGAAALVASTALAQAPKPTAPADTTTPGANATAPAEDLSKKLNQSNGVIHPKEVDPGIEKGAPNVQDANVVPPPATSGGSAAPQPK